MCSLLLVLIEFLRCVRVFVAERYLDGAETFIIIIRQQLVLLIFGDHILSYWNAHRRNWDLTHDLRRLQVAGVVSMLHLPTAGVWWGGVRGELLWKVVVVDWGRTRLLFLVLQGGAQGAARGGVRDGWARGQGGRSQGVLRALSEQLVVIDIHPAIPVVVYPRLNICLRWTDCLHGNGFHSSQSGLLVEQLLDVGSGRAFGLRDRTAFLQGPGCVVQPASQGLKVRIAGVPVRVGQEGEELGGAERARRGSFCRLSTDPFAITQTTVVSLAPVRHTGPRIQASVVWGDRLLPPAGREDWLPVHCNEAETLTSEQNQQRMWKTKHLSPVIYNRWK